MIVDRLKALDIVSARKLVAIAIFASGILKVIQFAFFQLIGLIDSPKFYIYQTIAALILGVGVYRGHRWAWATAAFLYALLAYRLLSSLESYPWSSLFADWKIVVIMISIAAALTLYLLIVLSFFWLERMRINTIPQPTNEPAKP
jgi:hypothetical protein